MRFRQTLARLHEGGARTFVVVGPGAALRALVRRNLPAGVEVLATETEREIEAARRALSQEAA